jgi:hypothetical protein
MAVQKTPEESEPIQPSFQSPGPEISKGQEKEAEKTDSAARATETKGSRFPSKIRFSIRWPHVEFGGLKKMGETLRGLCSNAIERIRSSSLMKNISRVSVPWGRRSVAPVQSERELRKISDNLGVAIQQLQNFSKPPNQKVLVRAQDGTIMCRDKAREGDTVLTHKEIVNFAEELVKLTEKIDRANFQILPNSNRTRLLSALKGLHDSFTNSEPKIAQSFASLEGRVAKHIADVQVKMETRREELMVELNASTEAAIKGIAEGGQRWFQDIRRVDVVRSSLTEGDKQENLEKLKGPFRTFLSSLFAGSKKVQIELTRERKLPQVQLSEQYLKREKERLSAEEGERINTWARSCGSKAILNTFGRIPFIMIDGTKIEKTHQGSPDDELRQAYEYSRALFAAYKKKNPTVPDKQIEAMVNESMFRQSVDYSTISAMVYVGTFSGEIAVADVSDKSRFSFVIDGKGIMVHKDGALSQRRIGGKTGSDTEELGQIQYTTTALLNPGDEELETWTETLETKKK